jgi:hypothetical protein
MPTQEGIQQFWVFKVWFLKIKIKVPVLLLVSTLKVRSNFNLVLGNLDSTLAVNRHLASS